MRVMAKGAGYGPPKLATEQTLPSRRRRTPSDSNGHFLRAFADALRDILREEPPARRVR
jgi:hypothetical protein